MSVNEILHEIAALPDDDRHRLMDKLFTVTGDESDWARFSASQLAAQYAPEDRIYDEG